MSNRILSCTAALTPTHPIFCDPLFSSPEYAACAQEMQAPLSITSPEEDPHMVAIQKVIPHVGDHLHTMRCEMQMRHATLATKQDVLTKKVEELTATLNDFTSGHFQLTFTPGKSRMLPQGFDHTLHRREEPSSPSLRVARQILPPSTLVSSSSFSVPPRSLDGPAPCAPSVLEALEKSDEVPKYLMSQKLKTIPEMLREWTVGSMGDRRT